MERSEIRIVAGIPEDCRSAAVQLIDEAFRTKLAMAIPDDEQRWEILAEGVDLSQALGAFAGERLVGIAGLGTTEKTVFDQLTFRMLREKLGIGSIRAAVMLYLLDVAAPPNTLRLEFLAVDASMRGQGVGSRLLDAVERRACQLGKANVELDVVDTNPDAERLYARRGFQVTRVDRLPIPASWMGFRASHTMTKTIDC